ncbi:MAG TPA: endonuclease III [Clostridiales bacterium]|nr:endonuclease III [Clostridiales bacterium]
MAQNKRKSGLTVCPCPHFQTLYPDKKKRALAAVSLLEDRYPTAECALQHEGDPFRLLVMAILSAQCTDKRVNLVAPALFSRFPDAHAMAQGELLELASYIRTCGLYQSKAKNLLATAKILDEKHQGQVPDTREELLLLPGVGRKVANLLLGDLFGIPGIVADTHCIRISNRMGLCDSPNPHKVEKQLSELIPLEKQINFCHRLVWFGRELCSAPTPKCQQCPLQAEFAQKNRPKT